jgi:two-component system, LytTR family, response regulator
MTNSISAVVVDDEVSSRNTLKKFLSMYCPEVSITAECGTVKEALVSIKHYNPDLVFLDIHMPDGDGFDVLQNITGFNFEIIFITGLDNYAIKAIKYAAIDYLVKPLVAEELKHAVNRVLKKKNETAHLRLSPVQPQSASKLTSSTRIAVPDSNGLKIIHLHKLIYCKAEGNYTEFVLTEGKILICKTLKEYEMLLPQSSFLRIHNSFIINLDHVKTYLRGRGGQLEMSNGEFLDVARNRKQLVLEVLTG